MIDAHQHFWRIDRGDNGWLTPALGAIHRDFGPADLAPILDRHDIDATIFVQAAPALADTHWLLELFGPRRLLWGSDWPVVDLAGGYDRWRGLALDAPSGLDAADQAAILGGNAARGLSRGTRTTLRRCCRVPRLSPLRCQRRPHRPHATLGNVAPSGVPAAI